MSYTTEQKQQIEKALQSHVDKLIPEITKIETRIFSEPDLPVGKIQELYNQAAELEKLVQWMVNLSNRVNPQKVIGPKDGVIRASR